MSTRTATALLHPVFPAMPFSTDTARSPQVSIVFPGEEGKESTEKPGIFMGFSLGQIYEEAQQMKAQQEAQGKTLMEMKKEREKEKKTEKEYKRVQGKEREKDQAAIKALREKVKALQEKSRLFDDTLDSIDRLEGHALLEAQIEKLLAFKAKSEEEHALLEAQIEKLLAFKANSEFKSSV